MYHTWGMTNKLKATTRGMIPVLAQIVQRYLPGHKIEELAKDEVVKGYGKSILHTPILRKSAS